MWNLHWIIRRQPGKQPCRARGTESEWRLDLSIDWDEDNRRLESYSRTCSIICKYAHIHHHNLCMLDICGSALLSILSISLRNCEEQWRFQDQCSLIVQVDCWVCFSIPYIVCLILILCIILFDLCIVLFNLFGVVDCNSVFWHETPGFPRHTKAQMKILPPLNHTKSVSQHGLL